MEINEQNIAFSIPEDFKTVSYTLNLPQTIGVSEPFLTTNTFSTVYNGAEEVLRNRTNESFNELTSCVPVEVPEETTTILYENKGIFNAGIYDCGCLAATTELLPAVFDVEIINGTVVIVYFFDGTQEKAVLSRDDDFSFERGISICLMKKMLSDLSYGNGSSLYNKLIKRCLNIYKKNRKVEQDVEDRKRVESERVKKLIEKSKEKKARMAAAEREAQIEIQKEAYLRALKEYGNKPQAED